MTTEIQEIRIDRYGHIVIDFTDGSHQSSGSVTNVLLFSIYEELKNRNAANISVVNQP